MEIRKVDISIGTDFYKTLQRTDISLEGAFREMIDNSTTSFMDHKQELKEIGEDKCKVTIDWDDEAVIVQDNAYGMNFDDFSRAFGLNKKAKQYSPNSRSQYGLGLKYGAIAIGSEYTVETIELGSGKKYKGTLDVDYLDEVKPESIDSEVTDVPTHYHGTKISIRKLSEYKYNSYIKPKSKTLDNLKKKLSLIYSDDLRNNRLELWLNKEQIYYEEPTWQTDANGNYVYKNFSNSFSHNGIEYKYSGWLGQLETADVAGAGFSLLQKNRAVEINYRPSEIFGQSNSFPYQRIVGEINLSGDNWIVSFTKSKVKWQENVEQLFIESLLELTEIKDVKSYVNKFRKNNRTITPEEIRKKQKEENKKVTKQSKTEETDKKEEVSKETQNSKKEDPTPFIVIPQDDKTKENKDDTTEFEYSYKGKKYKFFVKSEKTTNNSFYKLIKKNGTENEYYLSVDTFYGIFASNSKNANEKYFNLKIASYLALSQIIAETRGVKKSDSQILIDTFNELINK